MNTKPPYHLSSLLHAMELTDQRVLLRADLNVPLQNKEIISDFRLQSTKPTLDLLQEKGAQTLIVTHLGRPKNHEESLSTNILMKWFVKNKYDIVFAKTIEDAEIFFKQNKRLILLENIRFWPGEKKNDLSLAKALKKITDMYVMDAFGVAHRTDTTVTLLPELYQSSQRTIGLLVEKELKELNRLLEKPKHPFLALLGGAKIETKLPLIEHLLPNIDTLALLPALSFTFMKAQQQEIGKSLLISSLIPEAQKIIYQTTKLQKNLLLPLDYIVSDNGWESADKYSAHIQKNETAFGIGHKTVSLYAPYLQHAQTILFNGIPGDLEYPKTMVETKALLKQFCSSNAYKLAAGGDTIATIQKYHLESCFNFLSTGGGATLHYLSGKSLPGLLNF